MNYRILGKTKYSVSEIGLGTWSYGADWGNVTEENAMSAMETAVNLGVNFFDTADVYGNGRSEKLIAKFLKSKKKKIYVATKLGRRIQPHIAKKFTTTKLEPFIDRSLKNLRINCLNLIQLHCPPTDVYYMPEIFDTMDRFVKKGKIRYYGVSVEKIEEGIKAMQYPNVSTIQIIYNMFRQRPNEFLFKEALRKNVGIIVRVPLASGMLTGSMKKTRKFLHNDHRSFNRHGEAFDKGETFAGVDFEKGLRAVEEIKRIFPSSTPLSRIALRWILMEKAVSTTIPGAKNELQATLNASSSDLPALTKDQMEKIKEIYEKDIKPSVHQRW